MIAAAIPGRRAIATAASALVPQESSSSRRCKTRTGSISAREIGEREGRPEGRHEEQWASQVRREITAEDAIARRGSASAAPDDSPTIEAPTVLASRPPRPLLPRTRWARRAGRR